MKGDKEDIMRILDRNGQHHSGDILESYKKRLCEQLLSFINEKRKEAFEAGRELKKEIILVDHPSYPNTGIEKQVIVYKYPSFKEDYLNQTKDENDSK